jgi:hypothetical protein
MSHQIWYESSNIIAENAYNLISEVPTAVIYPTNWTKEWDYVKW